MALFGVSLSVSPASAYPSGATVSVGSNPIRSAAGRMDPHTTSTVSDVIAAPADQDLILTDIVLALSQADSSCKADGMARLQDDTGKTYADFVVSTPNTGNAAKEQTVFRAQSGIHVPASTSLTLVWTWNFRNCPYLGYHYLTYIVSGYLAQP